VGTAQPPGQEMGSTAYLVMARFRRDPAAKRVYNQIQEAIRATSCDLSVCNLRLNGEPIVVVVGDQPTPDLDERIHRCLAAGIPTDLQADVITLLRARSIEERAKAPWSEGHYGAGKRLV
jgi:hypothetical protein